MYPHNSHTPCSGILVVEENWKDSAEWMMSRMARGLERERGDTKGRDFRFFFRNGIGIDRERYVLNYVFGDLISYFP